MNVRATIGGWVARVHGPLVLFVIAVGLVAWSATWVSHRWGIWVFIALLVAAGWWLSYVMGNERRDVDGPPVPWWWRVGLALVLLGIGVFLVATHAAPAGFFLGITLLVTSLAWLVSELRHWQRSPAI